MDKSSIPSERKDEIIEALLGELMCGITQDGLDSLESIMDNDELKAYGYDLSEVETEG